MELKEGMYVRTKGGFIDKIIAFKSTISNDYVELEDEYYANKKDILKASHNIIDLIEVGDYVNGYKVMEIDEYKPIGCDLQKYLKVDCCKLLNAFYQEDIKTIVTKEQFESTEYKILLWL